MLAPGLNGTVGIVIQEVREPFQFACAAVDWKVSLGCRISLRLVQDLLHLTGCVSLYIRYEKHLLKYFPGLASCG